MDQEQRDKLQLNIQNTFPALCMSKEASFDMQNMIK